GPRHRGAVDVGYEVNLQPVGGVRLEGAHHHLRPKVRAADADVDDVGEALASEAGDDTGMHVRHEHPHAVENAVDLGHHVVAVHEDRSVESVAQGDVQDGAVLGEVDALAGEHRSDRPLYTRCLGK